MLVLKTENRIYPKTFRYWLILLLSLVWIPTCKKKSAIELESDLLTSFIEPKTANYIQRKHLRFILYDIKHKGKTSGRAVHIGDEYYLTAFHVIDGRNSNIQLIPQVKRDQYKRYSQNFHVLYYDINSDLALLRAETSRDRTGKPIITLAPEIPPPGRNVSKFLALIGEPQEVDYEFEYSGLDFFDPKKDYGILGRILLPAKSLTYELEGHVLPYNKKFFAKAFSEYKSNRENRRFSTMLTYNGDSGSPVFLKADDHLFAFCGIITHSYAINHEFETPDHPLDYNGMQQAGGIFSHKEPIENLILQYLLHNEQPQSL